MTIKNLLLDFHHIKRASLIGKMVKMIYFMKNIRNILSIHCHLKVNLIINKISMKNSKKNWRSITRCYKPLDKIPTPWLAWANTNLRNLSLKLQTKKLFRLLKCNLDQLCKHKLSRLLGLKPCQPISTHSTKKSSWSITIKLVNWI